MPLLVLCLAVVGVPRSHAGELACAEPGSPDALQYLFRITEDERLKEDLVDCRIPSPDGKEHHGALLSEKACFMRGGVFMRDNPGFAISVWAADARAGMPPAMYELAGIYDRGHQRTLAAYWYEKAALAGHRKAAERLAHKYRTGDGVPLDWGLAIKWARIASTTRTSTLKAEEAVQLLSELSRRLREAEGRASPELDLQRR